MIWTQRDKPARILTREDIQKERRALELEGGASGVVWEALSIAERYIDCDATRVGELESGLETLYEAARKYKKRVGTADEPLLVALGQTERLIAVRGGGIELSARLEEIIARRGSELSEEAADYLRRSAAILRDLGEL